MSSYPTLCDKSIFSLYLHVCVRERFSHSGMSSCLTLCDKSIFSLYLHVCVRERFSHSGMSSCLTLCDKSIFSPYLRVCECVCKHALSHSVASDSLGYLPSSVNWQSVSVATCQGYCQDVLVHTHSCSGRFLSQDREFGREKPLFPYLLIEAHFLQNPTEKHSNP